MNSHNTESNLVAENKPADSVADEDEMRVTKASQSEAADFATSEKDDKCSGDPYNSTGHHVIIAVKSDLKD